MNFPHGSVRFGHYLTDVFSDGIFATVVRPNEFLIRKRIGERSFSMNQLITPKNKASAFIHPTGHQRIELLPPPQPERIQSFCF